MSRTSVLRIEQADMKGQRHRARSAAGGPAAGNADGCATPTVILQGVLSVTADVTVIGILVRIASGNEPQPWQLALPNNTLYELDLTAVQPLPVNFIPGWQVCMLKRNKNFVAPQELAIYR